MELWALGPLPGAYFIFVVFLFGACAGSFVNCLAMRLVRGEKIARGRSHCMACGHTLGVRDLFPIVSWLCLRGKCRFCGEKISPRYPLTELLSALVFVAALLRFGLRMAALEHCLLFALLLALALVDLETMELPDLMLLVGVLIWALFLPFAADPMKRIIQGLLGAFALGGVLLLVTLLMDKIMKKETMGGGDIKLFAMLGLFTGPAVGLLLVLFSCVAGLIMSRLPFARGKPFPFGPAIAAAAVPALLTGQRIVDWYMGLFM